MKGDLHIHSKYSPDSRTEPDDIIKYSVKLGLDFISISDHNKFNKYKSESIIIIPGEEVTSIDGHILALFIEEEIPKGLSQMETIDRIHDSGGIAILAHPFRMVNGIGKKYVNSYDAVEVKNSRCGKGCNRKALKLANQLNVGKTAGSDAHFLNEIGRVYLEIPDGDMESIRKAIIKGIGNATGEDLTFRNRILLYWKMGSEYASRGFKRI